MFDEDVAVKKMMEYVRELWKLVESCDDLRAVSRKTYEMRRVDPMFPYMSIFDTDRSSVLRLVYFPTKTQAEADWLFRQVAEGTHVLVRYTLFIDSTGVHFTKRVGDTVKEFL